MFRASSVPIIRSYLLYARQLVRDHFLAETGWNLNLSLLGSGHVACMKRTNFRAYSR